MIPWVFATSGVPVIRATTYNTELFPLRQLVVGPVVRYWELRSLDKLCRLQALSSELPKLSRVASKGCI